VAVWLEEPAAPYRVYDESLAKVYFATFADDVDTARLLSDQQRHHTELLAQFEQLGAVLEAADFGGVVPGQLYALRLGIAVERAYLRWIGQTRAELANLQGKLGDGSP
jgi:hypothetical protein